MRWRSKPAGETKTESVFLLYSSQGLFVYQFSLKHLFENHHEFEDNWASQDGLVLGVCPLPYGPLESWSDHFHLCPRWRWRQVKVRHWHFRKCCLLRSRSSAPGDLGNKLIYGGKCEVLTCLLPFKVPRVEVVSKKSRVLHRYFICDHCLCEFIFCLVIILCISY